MRVVSKLAQIDFAFGRISHDRNLLVIESGPQSKIPATVYVSPDDVVQFLKRFLTSPGAILFVVALPWFLVRWRRHGQAPTAKARSKREWPTV